jgi:hypothetical protein
MIMTRMVMANGYDVDSNDDIIPDEAATFTLVMGENTEMRKQLRMARA